MAQSKLDLLAQKEEELRRINEELDAKNKSKIIPTENTATNFKVQGNVNLELSEKSNEKLQPMDDVEGEESADSADQFKGQMLKESAGKKES